MAAGDGQDLPELLTASDLARALGVSPSTIWNWTKRDRNPLRSMVTDDGAVRFTWFQLEEFCEANPRLRGVHKVVPPTTSQDQAPTAPATATQIEELKSITRDLRNAANASLQAALEGARLAEETARSHRVQLEHIAEALAAYEAALANTTAPSTIND